MKSTEQNLIAFSEVRLAEADPFLPVREELEQVEALLRERVTSNAGLILEVGRYILLSGGKRFRPALHMLAANVVELNGGSRFWMAAALECVHTATLLHDDVVDGASIRRGIPAANTIWGDHTAVLVGDFLFATSVEWVLSIENSDLHRRFAQVCKGMAEGEAYQLATVKSRRLNEEDYLRIVSLKTAGLISLACSSAAILKGSDKDTENALARYGHSVGMAFQIVDDSLDYCSDEVELGKAIGKDLEEGKITLPMLYALDQAGKEDRRTLETILDSRPFNPGDLSRAQKIIRSYQGIDYAMRRARLEVEQAKSALSILAPSTARNALSDMAEFAVTRSR